MNTCLDKIKLYEDFQCVHEMFFFLEGKTTFLSMTLKI